MRRVRKVGVFLSFAGPDREKADQLRADLDKHGIGASSFEPGNNLVQDINRALAQSDYFVLLWSKSAVDRPWVVAEWSAAFMRQLREQRSFFFIVRLDTTPLPMLLAPRHYLDAFDNWNGMVKELVVAWRQDRGVGEPVLPAPGSAPAQPGAVHGPIIELYVRNKELSVAHVIRVPANSTGQQLERLVHAELALPHDETKFNGAVGARFRYQLKNAERQIPVDNTPLAELGITDRSTIDLQVQVEWVGPSGPSPTVTYRGGPSSGFYPALKQRPAFAHLIPR
ncbi:MAG: toll/interleukin-1 receptor domain-containing protein [Pseudonocardiaceae bacterium]